MDPPRIDQFRGRKTLTSHLCSTLSGPEGTAELVAFAVRVGLNETWIQKKPTNPEHEHFDLMDSKCNAAIRAGAKVLPGREIALVWRAKREALAAPTQVAP